MFALWIKTFSDVMLIIYSRSGCIFSVMRIRMDPLIFGLLDPLRFPSDPDPTCKNGYIKLFSPCLKYKPESNRIKVESGAGSESNFFSSAEPELDTRKIIRILIHAVFSTSVELIFPFWRCGRILIFIFLHNFCISPPNTKASNSNLLNYN